MGSHDLLAAATCGEVEFLKANDDITVADPGTYWGSSDNKNRNLIHLAVENGHYAFLSKVLNMLRLHPKVVIQLICQADSEKCNPLHIAAKGGNIFIVKLLVNAYNRAVSTNNQEHVQQIPPWLARNRYKQTPVGTSLEAGMKLQENIGRYLVRQDEHLLRSLGYQKYPTSTKNCSTMILDQGGAGILYRAMERGFSLLAHQILTSSHLPYSLSGIEGDTPLHHGYTCNEDVSRLLLEKHPELIVKYPLSGESVLDVAVEKGATWLVKLMLIEEDRHNGRTGRVTPYGYRPQPWIKACRRLIWYSNPKHIPIYKSKLRSPGDTPLHVAARKAHIDIALLLIQGYQSALQNEAADWNADDDDEAHQAGAKNVVYPLLGVDPLKIKNENDETPIIVAFKNEHDDCGVVLSMKTFPKMVSVRDGDFQGEALEAALENGCVQSAKAILGRLVRGDVNTLERQVSRIGINEHGVIRLLNHISKIYGGRRGVLKSEVFEELLEIITKFLKEKEKDAKTHLIEAAERGEDWLVGMFLESDRDLYLDSAPAWQAACEKGHLSTLLIFIDKTDGQKFNKHCKQVKQTPLHHLKMLQFEQYMELMKMPVLEKLKNQVDSDGATPLHCAILRDDLDLTRALLETKGIDVNTIKNKYGKTASELLENRCKFSKPWGKMCREIEQESTVKGVKYQFRRVSFEGMQDTLSVVAALVATIAFAAGFAFPGGVDCNSSKAVVATKAAFLVFSVSNTIALCCSIMVLFLLLGPMLWDPQPSLIYINWSLGLLLLSLASIIFTFMTGVYIIMVPKVEWDPKFVLVVCSFTLLAACFVLLRTYSSRFKNFVAKPIHCLRKLRRRSHSQLVNNQPYETTITQSASTSTPQGTQVVPEERSDKRPHPYEPDKVKGVTLARTRSIIPKKLLKKNTKSKKLSARNAGLQIREQAKEPQSGSIKSTLVVVSHDTRIDMYE